MTTTYIDLSALRVGDVLLSKSKDKVHRFITKATGGRFAHAAIYVRRYQIFEATRTGVGFSALEPERIEFDARNNKRVLCSTKMFDEIAVYRCPSAFREPPSDNDDTLYTALYPILWTMNGLEYKKLVDLKNIRSRYDWVPKPARAWLLKSAGKLFLKDHKKDLIEEFFCSELIVHALQEVGMSVLNQDDVCAGDVSPKDLADSSMSNLQMVPGALRAADSTARSGSDTDVAIEQMLATPVSNKRTVKMTRELRAVTDTILKRMKESVRNR